MDRRAILGCWATRSRVVWRPFRSNFYWSRLICRPFHKDFQCENSKFNSKQKIKSSRAVGPTFNTFVGDRHRHTDTYTDTHTSVASVEESPWLTLVIRVRNENNGNVTGRRHRNRRFLQATTGRTEATAGSLAWRRERVRRSEGKFSQR